MESRELRDARQKLVTTAHAIMRWACGYGNQAEDDTWGKSVDVRKTQLTHLVSVCSEASCVEEIEAYIRYQSSRKQDGKSVFGASLARRIIEEVQPSLEAFDGANKLRAWRLYAVFLSRELTYFDARRQADRREQQEQAGHGGRRR